MKTIVSVSLVSFLVVLSGVALASQSGEQKERPSMPMMEEMMKGGKEGEYKDGMMRTMKMMDQCASMMESMHSKAEQMKEGQKK